MARKAFLSQFADYPVFTKQNLRSAAEHFSISANTLNSYVNRAITKEELVVLKRGVYVTDDFFYDHRSKQDYIFYIASTLLTPSYVSRESALQYYGLLSETNASVVTCVSANTTRRFKNRLGLFDYTTVKSDLFTGYHNIKKEFNFYIAEPYKALFDYLYFRIPKKDLKEKSQVLYYLDEFRIDYDDIGPQELEKLFALISTI